MDCDIYEIDKQLYAKYGLTEAEGNETVTNCNQLKLRAADGKMRMTAAVVDEGQELHSFAAENKIDSWS